MSNKKLVLYFKSAIVRMCDSAIVGYSMLVTGNWAKGIGAQEQMTNDKLPISNL